MRNRLASVSYCDEVAHQSPYKSSAGRHTSPAFIDHSIFLGRGGATLKAPPPESRAWAQFVYSTIYRSSSRAGRSSSRPQMAIGQTGRRSWQIRLSRPRSNHPYLVRVLKNSLKVVYLPVGINFEVIGIQLQCTLDHGPVVVIRAHGVEDFVLEPVWGGGRGGGRCGGRCGGSCGGRCDGRCGGEGSGCRNDGVCVEADRYLQ